MSCPQIITGEEFLTRTIAHIDCQAEIIGSYGYLALGQPGSLASMMVTSLLTLFVAFFGIRLMLGWQPSGRDIVGDVLKIGIVLTLAFSWPAFRTVIYDVTLKGPTEIAGAIQTSSQAGGSADLVDRLQRADDSIVQLIEAGTGRQTGQFINPDDPGFSANNDTQLAAALERAETADSFADYFYAMQRYTAAFNDSHMGYGVFGSTPGWWI